MRARTLVRVLQGSADLRANAIQSNEGGGLRMSLLEHALVDVAWFPPLDEFNVPENGNPNAAGIPYIVMAWVRHVVAADA